MILRAAIRYQGKQHNAENDETHPDLLKKHDIPEDSRHQRGFVSPNGQFLSRQDAKLYLRSKDPTLFKKWAEIAGGEDEDLHSEDLFDAMSEEKPTDLSKMKCLVIDLGLFTESAVRIGRDVAECWYYIPHEDAFPEPFQVKVGEGLEGVERVVSPDDYIDKADFIFFPDMMFAGKVEWLKAHNYPVCGAGAAERLELDRWYAREVQRKAGLPTQDTYRVKGLTNLRTFTKQNKNFWVKIDVFRGLEETFFYTDEKDAEQTLDKLAHKLGPYKESITFILEERLPGKEPGIDFITFDGELVLPTMIGFESKGVGIIEKVYRRAEDVPGPAMWVYEGFAPEFKKFKTRMFASLEFMIDEDQQPYVIDPSIRHAAPGCHAIQTELITNYTPVVHGLATGKKVRPVFSHKYAAAAAMEASCAEKDWVNISFPKELRQWIKLRMAVKIKEDFYAVPGFESVGCVIGFGNTVDEALKLVEERAEQIKGKRLSKGVKELFDLKKDIEIAKANGIEF